MEDTKELREEALIEKQARERQREESATEAFHGEGEVTINGRKIRPFSFGSLTVCRRLKFTLFTQEGSADEMSEDETMRQLAGFFWIQSQPPREILAHVRAGTANEAIDEFQFDVDVSDLPAIMRRVKEISKLAGEAAVDVAPKPNSKAEGEPGN